MITFERRQPGGFGTLALLLFVACAQPAAPDPSALADQVRRAETAFAQTMADRDLNAFSSFLDDQAVFVSGGEALRGKAAIAAGWRRFFEGASAPFAWRPEVVEVLDSGELALSSGPVLDPGGSRVGTFNSIWRRAADGGWKIVFDNGCPACECPPVQPAAAPPS